MDKSIPQLRAEKKKFKKHLEAILNSDNYKNSPSNKLLKQVGELQGKIDFMDYSIEQTKSKIIDKSQQILIDENDFNTNISELINEKNELSKQLIELTIAKTDSSAEIDKNLIDNLNKRISEIDNILKKEKERKVEKVKEFSESMFPSRSKILRTPPPSSLPLFGAASNIPLNVTTMADASGNIVTLEDIGPEVSNVSSNYTTPSFKLPTTVTVHEKPKMSTTVTGKRKNLDLDLSFPPSRETKEERVTRLLKEKKQEIELMKTIPLLPTTTFQTIQTPMRGASAFIQQPSSLTGAIRKTKTEPKPDNFEQTAINIQTDDLPERKRTYMTISDESEEDNEELRPRRKKKFSGYRETPLRYNISEKQVNFSDTQNISPRVHRPTASYPQKKQQNYNPENNFNNFAEENRRNTQIMNRSLDSQESGNLLYRCERDNVPNRRQRNNPNHYDNFGDNYEEDEYNHRRMLRNQQGQHIRSRPRIEGPPRESYLKRLKEIPKFSGESHLHLKDFIEISDSLYISHKNDAEETEFMDTVMLRLRGEARDSIINLESTTWKDIRDKLLSHFSYLSNKDILTSQIENLKQEKDESLIKYSERVRKLLMERNSTYNFLTEDQRQEHNRQARKAFAKGIKDSKLRDRMITRGAHSLEDAIAYAIETENETNTQIARNELFCGFCRINGHRENECRRKPNNSNDIGNMVNLLRSLNINPSRGNQRNFSGQNWNNNRGFNNNGRRNMNFDRLWPGRGPNPNGNRNRNGNGNWYRNLQPNNNNNYNNNNNNNNNGNTPNNTGFNRNNRNGGFNNNQNRQNFNNDQNRNTNQPPRSNFNTINIEAQNRNSPTSETTIGVDTVEYPSEN